MELVNEQFNALETKPLSIYSVSAINTTCEHRNSKVNLIKKLMMIPNIDVNKRNIFGKNVLVMCVNGRDDAEKDVNKESQFLIGFDGICVIS